ncbi:hypothetical protein ESA94_00420 [Lacibacter luteus]|uniref:Uncharacterized protein n=1 Tax=Lacibacter luteus TaxID=2508719 RepID=A0A4Q1CLQ0_9BACT|nr:hypothetical protein [Lacibacter luteus]RXK61519.1 hypothetical protein ESA94_00420 [Lacibacter luteus]
MNTKEILNAIGTIVSLIASIIAIVVFLVKGFELEDREIKIQATTWQDLTKSPRIQDFEASYSFQGKKVEGIWLLTLKCKNVGNKPIIGYGKNSNFQNDYILINIDSNYRLLASQPVENQIQSDLKVTNDNSVALRFQKWNPNELLVLQFYLEPKKKDSMIYPSLAFNHRELIDCNFSFSSEIEDYFIQHPLNKVAKIFPLWSIPFLIGGSLFSIILCFMPLLIFLIVSVKQKISYNLWSKNYLSTLIKKIDSSIYDDIEKTIYKNNHSKIPQEVWNEFRIPKPHFPTPRLLALFNLFSASLMAIIGFFNLVVYFSIFFL